MEVKNNICEQAYKVRYSGNGNYTVERWQTGSWASCSEYGGYHSYTQFTSLEDANAFLEKVTQYRNYQEFSDSFYKNLPSYTPSKA